MTENGWSITRGGHETPDERPVMPEEMPSDPAGEAEVRRRILNDFEKGKNPIEPEVGLVHEDRSDAPTVDAAINHQRQRRVSRPVDPLEPDAIAYRAKVEEELAEAQRDIERTVTLIGGIDVMPFWKQLFSFFERRRLAARYDAAIEEEQRLRHQLENVSRGISGGTDIG
jgi:hypothetical protein